MSDGGKTKALGNAFRRARRLPGDALIDLAVEHGLLEEVPVRHRFGSIVQTSGSRAGWLTESQEDLPLLLLWRIVEPVTEAQTFTIVALAAFTMGVQSGAMLQFMAQERPT